MTNLDDRAHKFQFAGALLESAFYVARQADWLLSKLLIEGRYCNVLAPRQIGKSSLGIKVSRELRKAGIRCATIDLTSIGTVSSPDDWYFGLVDEIARKLGLSDPMDYWEANKHLVPSRRWMDYLRRILRTECADQRIVLFLDEIEAVRLVPFPIDGFFLSIRSLFEERNHTEELRRLTFCMIGVTSPSDLVKDKQLTPINITEAVRLDDFTREQMDDLKPGLEGLGVEPKVLLDEIHAWTDGHPYMTMRLCAALVDRSHIVPGAEKVVVGKIVEETFLQRPLQDANLGYAARRFDDPHQSRAEMLTEKVSICLKLLDGAQIPANLDSDAQMELILCGMIKAIDDPEAHVIRFRNKIFASVFDRAWFRGKGDRRFIAESVWKWLDEKKAPAYLLRDAALDNALLWAKTAVLSDDENQFLEASQRLRNEELEAERARINKEAKEAKEELRSAVRTQMIRTGSLFVLALLTLIAFFAFWRIKEHEHAATLANMEGEIASKETKLKSAEGELSMTQDRLVVAQEGAKIVENQLEIAHIAQTQTEGTLGECTVNKKKVADGLTSCAQSLASAVLARDRSSADAAACQRDLRPCQQDRSSCLDERATCRQDSDTCKQESATCTQNLNACKEFAKKTVSRTLYEGTSKMLDACLKNLDKCEEHNL